MASEINSVTRNHTAPAGLLTKLALRPGVEAEFSSWHAKMCIAPAEVPGFVSAEVNAPGPGRAQWSVVQHFRSARELAAWRSSERHRVLMEEARALTAPGVEAAFQENEIAENALDGIVTEVVTTCVAPGKEGEYQEWARKIHGIEAQFPGYRGGFLQPPASGQQGYWTTLVRFATPDQLDAWLSSPARAALLKEHERMVRSWEHHRLPGSFAGWFPAEPVAGGSPPGWKQSLLVIVMLFPIVGFELRYLNPLLHGLNVALGTFIGNFISVFLLTWPGMPIVIAAMNWWLVPKKDAPKWTDLAGLALLTVIYALEIFAFSRLI